MANNILYYSIRQLRGKGSVQEKDKTVEIPMGVNQAYETVDSRYDARVQRREVKEQDEVIYDMPTV